MFSNTETATQRASVREFIANSLVKSLKPVYLYLRKNRKPWNITMEELEKMGNGTLGNDLYNFLHSHGLEIMPRIEFHDVYHVLFEYETDMKSETMIQFVPIGNGRISLPFLISTFVSAVFYPENWNEYYLAYLRGKKAIQFHDWNFESLLAENTEELRKQIFG